MLTPAGHGQAVLSFMDGNRYFSADLLLALGRKRDDKRITLCGSGKAALRHAASLPQKSGKIRLQRSSPLLLRVRA